MLVTLKSNMFVLDSVIFQEFEANIEGMKLDKTRVEQEEKRKTLAAETQQHQQVTYT